MPLQRCKSCGGLGARRMLVQVNHKHLSRQWIVLVCRDCWRAWEALLDSAAEGMQQMLRAAAADGEAATPFFW